MSTHHLARVRHTAPEWLFTIRSLRHSLRDGESLLLAIVLPVMLMLLMTAVFGGALDPTGSYVDFVAPAIILTCAGFGASTTSVYVANDLKSGIVDRFRSMPVRASAVLTGHVLASVLRNLLATSIVLVVAVLVGFRAGGTLLDWLGAAALITGYILAITYLFAAIGLAASSPESANGYGFILLFLPYLSSGFVPLESLVSWLRPLATYQPMTPIIDTIRALMLGGDPGNQWIWAVGWCLAILLFSVILGSWFFRRRTRR
ncbi:ABC transporter permease [Glutamicibacter sp. MNS18]|uniref:ABC transporter permease n=1 Tax=Glutamicibacter sp. MNS18 TaxID=2989817 RepID=UPI002236A989|nr:ABC transporter permease [Glutamicibacter sp. MNS18]MCW4464818.1 ABC transporter permease [Glutamicibacter sp. MNS18]